MPVPNFSATVDHFASRLAADHRIRPRPGWSGSTPCWPSKGDVFPSHQLLDHIPELLKEIAAYLRAPADQEIAANTGVMTKAGELGLLRFDQRFSPQLLREYQILSEILEFLRPRGRDARRARRLPRRCWCSAARSRPCACCSRRPSTRSSRDTPRRLRARPRSCAIWPPGQHEIRQPLSVLQVAARLLMAHGTDAEATRIVETLERNVVRLAEVAGTLERLARLTRRPIPRQTSSRLISLPVVHDVAGQLSDMAVARGVAFDIEPRLPTFAADAGRVELVVVNLLANAIEYCDPRNQPAPFASRPIGRAPIHEC